MYLTQEGLILICIIIANSLVYRYMCINRTILWYAFMTNTFVKYMNVPTVKYNFFFFNKVSSRVQIATVLFAYLFASYFIFRSKYN